MRRSLAQVHLHRCRSRLRRYRPPKRIRLPEQPKITEPAAAFQEAQHRLTAFFAWLGVMMARWDPEAITRLVLTAAANHLSETGGLEPDPLPEPPSMEEALTSGTPAVRELRAIGGQQVLSELLLTRSIDNFLTYLAQLLSLVFRCRPETLRSNQRVTVEFVLSHETTEELVDALAERRVDTLSTQSIDALAKYFQEELGFAVFPTDEDLAATGALVALRNLHVHNRGVVNRRYLRLIPGSPFRLGDRVPVSAEELFEGVDRLGRLVERIDAAAADKWDLTRTHDRPSVPSFRALSATKPTASAGSPPAGAPRQRR